MTEPHTFEAQSLLFYCWQNVENVYVICFHQTTIETLDGMKFALFGANPPSRIPSRKSRKVLAGILAVSIAGGGLASIAFSSPSSAATTPTCKPGVNGKVTLVPISPGQISEAAVRKLTPGIRRVEIWTEVNTAGTQVRSRFNLTYDKNIGIFKETLSSQSNVAYNTKLLINKGKAPSDVKSIAPDKTAGTVRGSSDWVPMKPKTKYSVSAWVRDAKFSMIPPYEKFSSKTCAAPAKIAKELKNKVSPRNT